MPPTDPFEEHADRYDAWFEAHEAAYGSELPAVGDLLPAGPALEVGVGTGRFAGPLGVEVGLDPAVEPLHRARDRGVVVRGVAEALPFAGGRFDAALLVTTVCLVDDLDAAFREALRVLRPDGRLVVGFVDADSPPGERHRERAAENPFYREATFVTTDALLAALDAAGFRGVTARQTLFADPADLDAPEASGPGYGDGSFVVVAASPT